MKYANAISPAAIKATGRVNNPRTSRMPPINSMLPAAPYSENSWTFSNIGTGGHFSSFAKPYCRNSNPAMSRSRLSAVGCHFASILSIWSIVVPLV
jgi:hypothetical protein